MTKTPMFDSYKLRALGAFIIGGICIVIGYAFGVFNTINSLEESGSYIPRDSYERVKNPDDMQVACTLEAKQCPDGSYVGRSGPNCEFSPCP